MNATCNISPVAGTNEEEVFVQGPKLSQVTLTMEG